MASTIDYEVPTWSQIYDMLLCQAQKIQRQNYKPDIIVGIARGGVVPARILADLLETPELGFIQIEFYTDINQTHKEPTLKQALTNQITNKKALLVDDIADTGESLQLAKNIPRRAKRKRNQNSHSIPKTTIYNQPQISAKNKQLNWIVFPWDTKETLRKIALKQQGERSLNLEVAKLVKAGLPKQLAEKLLTDTP